METERVTQMRIGIEAAKDDIRAVEKAAEISQTEGIAAGIVYLLSAPEAHEGVEFTSLTEEAYNRVMDKYRNDS